MNLANHLSHHLKVLDGNRASAYGVMLCRPDVICAYPITPQTEILEQLYQFSSDGVLSSEMVAPESEHSVMSILRGASACGGRTFTATAAQGLAFMFEVCINVASVRLPIVMVNVCREMIAPHSVTCSQQDVMMAREAGWIQVHTHSCQENLDTIIMAYRLSEDPDVRIPVMVCYDGYFLSHKWEPIEIPGQEQVDAFLPPLAMEPIIDAETPKTYGPFIPSNMGTEYRFKQGAAMERAKGKIDEIDDAFRQHFGRGYGGQIEEYKTGDADIVLLAVGSCVGTAKAAVDRKRETGVKVGLVNVRMFRPFPAGRLRKILEGRKAIGSIDRNISFGWNCGALHTETKAALFETGDRPPMLNFVCGLCGSDITLENIERAIDKIDRAGRGGEYQEVTWLDLE